MEPNTRKYTQTEKMALREGIMNIQQEEGDP